MKLKSYFYFFNVILFTIFVSTFFTAYRSQNLDKGVVKFNNQQYSSANNFQVNENYFNRDGVKRDYFTKVATINGSSVYSIKGLDIKNWIYFDYGDCDVSFYLSKNIAIKLNDRYFDFSHKFKLIKYNYTIKDGSQKVIDKIVEDKDLVSYAYKIASSNGNTDMGVTSDKLTNYSILLTPKNFPSLQYIINYYECKNGYFIGSNTNGLNTKVDDSIHEMIKKSNE